MATATANQLNPTQQKALETFMGDLLGRRGLVNAVPAQAHPNVAWRRVAMWLRHRPVTA
ncbi:MAG: hypothetical protein VX913_00690 [Planctomycetota bacterium]|nr:hypothetical protein [Planctomycetota bacterium]